MSVYAGYGVCVPIQRCERLNNVLTKITSSVTFASRVEGELLDKSRDPVILLILIHRL